MKYKNITIREIAKKTGYSIATVSRTLNGLGGVGNETRKNILAVCEELGYIPSDVARGMVLHKARIIGVIMPDIQSPFYAKLMALAGIEASKRGFQVLFSNSYRDYELERSYINLLISNEVEGILLFPVGEESGQNLRQFMRYVPIVSLNELENETMIPCVCADEYAAGRIATERLIRSGCKNIVYLGYSSGSIAYINRIKGFLDQTKESGVFGKVFEGSTQKPGENGYELGYRLFQEFWTRKSFYPDGIIASSDETARGLLLACKEYGVAVPQDFSLVAFDNIDAQGALFGITSVSISHQLHIEKAMDYLIELQTSKTLPESKRNLYLSPFLHEKDSCKAPSVTALF